jgi:ATP-dependent DNA ligase
MVNGGDMRRKPYVERKAGLRNLLRGDRGIQYVERAEEHGEKLFAAVCKLDLEGIVPKKLDSTYRGRPKLIDRNHRNLGSKSKIRRRPPQLALKPVR